MKYIIFLVLQIILLNNLIYSQVDEEFFKQRKRFKVNQVKDLIIDLIAIDRIKDLERFRKIYPESFVEINFSRAFYEAGIELYKKRNQHLALKCFILGYQEFEESIYKWYCGFYVAKIFYQLNNRDSAIYYINRVEKNVTEPGKFLDEIKSLKKRIRWEYISKFEGLPDESISDIYFDGDDVWICMWTGGVARFSRSSGLLRIFNTKDGLISPHVRCIEKIGNFFYVGTYDGLCSFNKKDGKWKREKGDLSKVTIKRLKLVNDKLYVATLGKGLYISLTNNINFDKLFSHSVNITDIQLYDGILYISTLDKGLYCYNGNNYIPVITNISAKQICVVNDKIWVGTHGSGIYIYDKVRDNYTVLTRENGLSSDYIESIEFISNKVIIGTLGSGVDIYDTVANQFRNINILDGLPSNDVVRIVFEKNRIWFGTLSGGIGILITDNFEDL